MVKSRAKSGSEVECASSPEAPDPEPDPETEGARNAKLEHLVLLSALPAVRGVEVDIAGVLYVAGVVESNAELKGTKEEAEEPTISVSFSVRGNLAGSLSGFSVSLRTLLRRAS